ncbi:alkaline phosphatase D family protein [Venatoribacter cucullus]|nr:alkaline phosphatase D family protein [Venatoribacter cucullus]
MKIRNELSRRSFLKSMAAGAGAVSVPAALTGCFGEDDDDQRDLTVFVFGHGVASGDPLADRVIIWTRVTPSEYGISKDAQVAWVVATDEDLTSVVASGTVYTNASHDYTVKVDVTGLSPDTTYYYQFAGKDKEVSPVGQTRTLPTGNIDSVKLAVCSCSNYPAGLFNVYRDIANSDAAVVLHLGDYIYEYGSNEYPKADAQVRAPEPSQEILSLSDYRARYSQYRSDIDLQEVHRVKPFICVWDDHELANDTWKNGAENHQQDEGEFSERRAAAIKAYHEWLPIRSNEDQTKIWRTFAFGDLVNLVMLDTRIVARDEPLSFANYITAAGLDYAGFLSDMSDTNRTLLGAEQQQQVLTALATDQATWQVLGQQVLMGRIFIPVELLQDLAAVQALLASGQDASSAQLAIAEKLAALAGIKIRILQGDDSVTASERARVETTAPYNLDAWDGYSPAREAILRTAQQADQNLVVLAGDTHNAWASDLYITDDTGAVQRSAGSAGVEFATPSVTSPGFENYVGFNAITDPTNRANQQAGFEQAVSFLVDDLKYLNSADRGYMLVDFNRTNATCEWVFVDTIASRNYTAVIKKKMRVEAGYGKRILENLQLV